MGRKYVSSGGLISIPTMIRVFFLFEPFLQVTDSGGGDLLSRLEAEGVLEQPEEVE